MRRLAAFTLGLILALPASGSADRDLWLHIDVDEGDGSGRVRINLPLTLVETVLPMVRTGELSGGRLRIGAHDLAGIDLETLAETLREAADGDYARIQDGDEEVTVRKEGGRLRIQVGSHLETDEAGHPLPRERVSIDVPIKVVRALATEQPGELDLLAAVRALQDGGAGGMIHVEDAGTRVRIWIDERSGQDE